jgi:hypothetical protein
MECWKNGMMGKKKDRRLGEWDENGKKKRE